jgi:group I intron endonuclease
MKFMVCQNEITDSQLNKLENKIDSVVNDSMTKMLNVCEKNRLNDTTTREKIVSGIYKILNKVNGKYYVGRSKDILGNRWNHHKKQLSRNCHDNDYLQRSWNKYGESNFEWIIVEEVPLNKLVETEQKYLDIAKMEQDKCYNCNFLADGQTWEPESREKKRRSMLGEKNFFYGRKHTNESKNLMSLTHIGLKYPNRKRPPKFSDEHLKNLKIAQNKRTFPKYKFYNVITGEEFFGTIRDFCQTFNLKRHAISRFIRLKQEIYKRWTIKPT